MGIFGRSVPLDLTAISYQDCLKSGPNLRTCVPLEVGFSRGFVVCELIVYLYVFNLNSNKYTFILTLF